MEENQNILSNMSKLHVHQVFYMNYMDRMVKDCKDQLVEDNHLKNQKSKMSRLKNIWTVREITSWNFTTSCWWISSVSRKTFTSWTMINDNTLRVISTSSWTRIFTFLIYAGFGIITFRIRCTFRSTARVRISEIFWQTWTWTGSISLFANCISSTRWRITRSCDFNRRMNWIKVKLNRTENLKI
jgi:hypothetical protein